MFFIKSVKGIVIMSIAVIYGSMRENGNTEELTEIAIQDLDVEQIEILFKKDTATHI